MRRREMNTLYPSFYFLAKKKQMLWDTPGDRNLKSSLSLAESEKSRVESELVVEGKKFRPSLFCFECSSPIFSYVYHRYNT